MKRSEMIKALETEYRDYFDHLDLNALLDFLESKGMLPPAHIKYAPTAYAEPNKKVIYEWEPEDDQHY